MGRMSSQDQKYFVYEATCGGSLVAGRWRLASERLGFREIDVPLESIPVTLRKLGCPVWVVWDKANWRMEAIFARTSNDASELPEEWRREYAPLRSRK